MFVFYKRVLPKLICAICLSLWVLLSLAWLVQNQETQISGLRSHSFTGNHCHFFLAFCLRLQLATLQFSDAGDVKWQCFSLA